MPSAERPLSSKDRFREVAALLAQGLLRLKTYPANQPPLEATAGKRPEKPPEFSKLRLDVRCDITPDVAGS